MTFEKFSTGVVHDDGAAKRTLRIAMFTDVFLEVPGGIPSSIRAQHDALTKMGYTVKIFAPGRAGSAASMPKNIRDDVVLLPAAALLRPGGAPLAKRPSVIYRFVKKKYPHFADDFDLIHVHYEAGASIAAVWLAREFRLPLVQTMHGREDMAIAVNVPHPFKTIAGAGLNFLHRKFLKDYVGVLQQADRTAQPVYIYGLGNVVTKKDDYLAPTAARARMWDLMVRQANCADVVITPSEHFAEKLKHYGVRRTIVPVSNGVADSIADVHDWKVRELKKGEPLRIAWYSRLSREKRVMEFLEAVDLAMNRGVKIELMLMGEGNCSQAARHFVWQHGLENDVRFIGAVPHEEVLERIQDQHLSVINSYGFDTQGLTILEAAVTGLPVIYCDPDMDGIVLPGGGMRAADQTPAAMADVLTKIWKQPELVREMSEAQFKGRKQDLQSAQIRKLIKVYDSVLPYAGKK